MLTDIQVHKLVKNKVNVFVYLFIHFVSFVAVIYHSGTLKCPSTSVLSVIHFNLVLHFLFSAI